MPGVFGDNMKDYIVGKGYSLPLPCGQKNEGETIRKNMFNHMENKEVFIKKALQSGLLVDPSAIKKEEKKEVESSVKEDK